MRWTEHEPPPKPPRTRAELRGFGLVMAAALTLLGAFLLWRGRDLAPYVLGAGAAFAVVGVAAPALLRPVETAWMWLAERLAVVVTTIVVTLTFFLVITPVGLIVRLVSRDTMGLRIDRSRPSYWVPVDPDGPGSRPDKPF